MSSSAALNMNMNMNMDSSSTSNSNFLNISSNSIMHRAARREKLERVRLQLQRVQTRPTTVAAEEFLALSDDAMSNSKSNSGSNSRNNKTKTSNKKNKKQHYLLLPWKTLPKRIEKLANRLREMTTPGEEDLTQNRIKLTAAITARAAADAKVEFLSAFYSLFRASLDGYYTTTNQRGGAGGEQEEEEKLYENLRFLGWLPTSPTNTIASSNDDSTRMDVVENENSTTTNNNNTHHHHHHHQSRAPSSLLLLLRPLQQAVQCAILEHVGQVIRGDYETPGLLQSVQEWTANHVESWLRDKVFHPSHHHTNSSSSMQAAGGAWSQRLRQMTAQAYGHTRLQEIFDIVADYPDSHTAVLDLRAVLEQQSSSSSSSSSSTSSASSSVLSLSNRLATTLRDSLVRRLNHPGANTTQIIDVYINTIKVLRVLEGPCSSDRLLAVVAEPVRRYLRGRTDTVRCMIASLTNHGSSGGEGNADGENATGESGGTGAGGAGNDLYQELRRQDAKPLENVTVDSDDEEECPDLYHWQPPPSIHKPRGTFLEQASRIGGGGDSSRSNHNNNNADILAMLVSIYGSKELFVNEYRLMLADKLLANLDYNTDKEVHTLELLKLRFGEMSMRSCEVMLKDLDDSKRSNANIKSFLEAAHEKSKKENGDDKEGGDDGDHTASTSTTKKNVVDAAMISHIFWPALQNDPLIHHPQLQYMLDTFGMEYARLKNPRKLIWLHQLGTVQLELEVVEEEDESPNVAAAAAAAVPTAPKMVSKMKEFSCSPLLATLILHFQDKSSWTAEDLSNETGIPQHLVQKRMTYWVNNRVVKIVVPSSPSSLSPSKGGGTGGGAGGPHYVLASVAHFGAGDKDNDGNGGGTGGSGTTMMEVDHILGGDGHGAFGGGLGGVSVSAQEEEEMDVYVSYIVGMLTNLGQLPLKTIHNNLKTFVTGSDHKYNKTPQQLSAFLQHLCKQERLECGPDGMYKLFKK